MADIRATPVSNRAAYYLAGLLDSANEAVSKPFGYENDPVRGLTNLLGVPSIVKTLENVAYGMPNTTGAGMATQLRPEAKETAANLLPMAPGAAKVAAKGAIEAGKYAAPKVGQMAEQYAAKTGLLNPMIAYHGSPYSFDAFDLAHVGKGEGAQAYGHGMYFAESPSVAGQYQKATSKDRFITSNGFFDPSELEHLNVRVKAREGDLDKAIETARKYGKPDADYPETAAKAARDLAKLEALKASGGIKPNEGLLYKVDIPDPAVATFLDWDKPLSQQPEAVRSAVASLPSNHLLMTANFDKQLSFALNRKDGKLTGAQIHSMMEDLYGSRELASALFKKSGIQGIRYLDGGSRGTGAGTSNFVVFDPSIVKILERNGQPMGLLETPFDKAHKVAQENATQVQGLIGTPAERAAEQGYMDFYHGTQRLDRLLEKKYLDPKRATSGPMPYGTPSPELASGYAMGKADTSRAANDMGDLKNYFQVSPKNVGMSGRNPVAVEDTWWRLPAEKRAEILDKAKRIGYENPNEAMGKFILHPDSKSMPFAESHWDYTLKREAGGNPLKALRQLYAESGILDAYAPRELEDIYRLAGYNAPISQTNAPWTEAKGVFVGKARITNPLFTDDAQKLQTEVVPYLKEQFKNDRSRKAAYGADPWDKRVRFTPKEWVAELENDLTNGANSHVWTSIPDKVTNELKALGYNGIIDRSGKGGGAQHPVVIPFEPGQIRSRFAQFDPARIGEPDLLAAGIPLGLIAGTEIELPKPKKAKK